MAEILTDSEIAEFEALPVTRVGNVSAKPAIVITPTLRARIVRSHRALAAQLASIEEREAGFDEYTRSLEAQVRALTEALNEAKGLTRIWHGFKDEDEELWRIYDTESPEMKRINATLRGADELGYKAISRFRERAVRAIRERLDILEKQTAELDGLAQAACSGRDIAIRDILGLVESLPLEPEHEEKL